MTTVADECPRGGKHVEGSPQVSGSVSQVKCTKCGTVMSTGMVAQPGDPDSNE